MKKPAAEVDGDTLQLMALEIQLYLANKYNLSAPETAIVFVHALGDTIAYALKPGSTVDQSVDTMVAHLRHLAKHRVENPPDMGLRDIVTEYKRTGGKGRKPS